MRAPRVAIASLAEEGLDSERTVLGSLLLDPTRLQKLTIDGSDFGKRHRPIFDALLACSVERGDFDPMSVTELLRKRGQYTEGDAAYVSSLTDGVPRHAAFDHHCHRIRQASLRRRLAVLGESITSASHDLVCDPSDALNRLRADLERIEDNPGGRDCLPLTSFDQIQPETLVWLIEPYLPKGCLSLLVGDPGCGKTGVALAFAAGLTRGAVPFAGPCAPRSVLYLGNEDSAGQLRARFDQLGGDPARIWAETPEKMIGLGETAAIEASIRKHSAALVVFDTLTSHFGSSVDFHKANEVAAVLGPLAAMAQRTDANVLGLMHLSKSMQGKSLYRVQGSTAFAGAARSILAIGGDPSDPSRRILAHLKANGSALAQSRSFTIGSDGVIWGAVSDLCAADVLGPESSAEDRGELSTATEFLRDALSNGSRDASELKAEAKEQGIAEITLKRAKAQLGVKSRKKSLRAGWNWSFPEGDHEADQSSLPQ